MDKFIVSLLRLWNGKERLGFAFWGVFVPIFFYPIVISLFSALHTKVLLPLLVIIFILLKIFSIVALWRCAPNASHNAALKCGLARAFAAFNAIVLVMVSTGFILALLW